MFEQDCTRVPSGCGRWTIKSTDCVRNTHFVESHIVGHLCWSWVRVLAMTGQLLRCDPILVSRPRWWSGSGHRNRRCVVVQLPPSTRPHYSRQNGPAAAAFALGCPLSRGRARRICRARGAVLPRRRRRISPATQPFSVETHVYRVQRISSDNNRKKKRIKNFLVSRFRWSWARTTRRQKGRVYDNNNKLKLIIIQRVQWRCNYYDESERYSRFYLIWFLFFHLDFDSDDCNNNNNNNSLLPYVHTVCCCVHDSGGGDGNYYYLHSKPHRNAKRLYDTTVERRGAESASTVAFGANRPTGYDNFTPVAVHCRLPHWHNTRHGGATRAHTRTGHAHTICAIVLLLIIVTHLRWTSRRQSAERGRLL